MNKPIWATHSLRSSNHRMRLKDEKQAGRGKLGRQARLSLPVGNESERSLGQIFSLTLGPTETLNPQAPQATPTSNPCSPMHAPPLPPSPTAGGQWVQESILLCLLSAPWEEDEIRRDRVEPQSVSLSWREPVPAGAPGTNRTEYEIRYYEKVSPSRKPLRSLP